MTTAIVQLFAGSSRGQAVLAGQARLQESMRHAFGFIARSARSAGYLGCGTAGNLANGLNGDWRQVVEFDVSTSIESFDGTGGGHGFDDWQPSLAALPMQGGGAAAFNGRNDIDPSRLRPGSDIVVFRRLEANGHRLLRGLATAGDPLVVADEEAALDADDFAVISTCRQAALFRITSVAERGGEATLARTAGSSPFDNRAGSSLFAAGVPYGDSAGPQAATVARVLAETYFVARGAAANNRGQPTWALWRKATAAPPVELVQGIDDMQLLFGIDSTPDDDVRAAGRYVRASTIGASAVRTVRISLTASSVDAVTAQDRPLTRTFSRTVALRN